MVTSQENGFAACLKAQKSTDDPGRVRSAINVIPEKDNPIALGGIDRLQQRRKSTPTPVNVPDSQSSHEVPAARILLHVNHSPALGDFANDPGALLLGMDEPQDGAGLVGGYNDGHSDPHVEDLIKFSFGDASILADELEERQFFPGALPDDDIAIVGEDTRDIVHKTAAGDVCQAFHNPLARRFASIEFFQKLLNERTITDMNP